MHRNYIVLRKAEMNVIRIMKICITYPLYFPYVGGVELHIHDLAAYLAHRGHEVYVFTSRMKRSLYKTEYPLKFNEAVQQPPIERKSGYFIIRFDPNIWLPNAKLATCQFLYQYYRAFKRFQKSNQFDIIHWHSLEKGGIGLLLNNSARSKNIITLHGKCYPSSDQFFIKRFIVQLIFNKADKIIAVSKEAEKNALFYKVAKGKVHYIPNWVDTEIFKPNPAAKGKDETRSILYVGRMVKHKGIEIIIRALNDLLKKGINIKGIFVGDGPDREFFISMSNKLGIREHVEFPGFLSPETSIERLVNYYSKADVFVLLSKSEGQSKVLLESMSCGTPVIAYETGGIPEIVTEDVGVLLKERSVEALKRAICELLSNDNKRREMGKNARQKVQKMYSKNVILPKIERVYCEVLSKA